MQLFWRFDAASGSRYAQGKYRRAELRRRRPDPPNVFPNMLTQLENYQASPCGATLGDFWLAAEPLARVVARSVAMQMGRVQDHHLLDEMIQASADRIVRMADRLLTLRFDSEARLVSYIARVARGAALTAMDDPTCGPSRRNAKRWKEPGEPLTCHGWPDEGAASIKDRTDNHTDTNAARVGDSPAWSHSVDHGNEWMTLVHFVAIAAKAIAIDWERVAVNQMLRGQTDAATAAKLSLSKSAWQDRKRKALQGLAPRIAASAPFDIDTIGEKLLGDSWIQAANRAWAAVVHRERDIFDEAA